MVGVAAAEASRAPARLGRSARRQQRHRMPFMMTSLPCGPGGGRPSGLFPLLAAAAAFTTHDRPQDCPQESATRCFR